MTKNANEPAFPFVLGERFAKEFEPGLTKLELVAAILMRRGPTQRSVGRAALDERNYRVKMAIRDAKVLLETIANEEEKRDGSSSD